MGRAGAGGFPGISRRGLVGLGGAVLLGGAVDLVSAEADVEIAPFSPRPPVVYERPKWRASRPRAAAAVENRKPDRIVIHHTATENTANHSEAHALALSRVIQRFHMEQRGWDDIGQQFTISRGGHLMEGRNKTLMAVRSRKHVVGAHTAGHNDHCVGIECEGTYGATKPTGPLWRSLVRLCAYLCNMYQLNPYNTIVGHRNFSRTSCPGDALYGRLPRLRREVDQLLIVPVGSPLSVVTSLPDLGTVATEPHQEFDHGPARSRGESL